MKQNGFYSSTLVFNFCLANRFGDKLRHVMDNCIIAVITTDVFPNGVIITWLCKRINDQSCCLCHILICSFNMQEGWREEFQGAHSLSESLSSLFFLEKNIKRIVCLFSGAVWSQNEPNIRVHSANGKHKKLDHYHTSTKAQALIARWKQRSVPLACGCLCASSLMSFISYSRIYWLTKIIGPAVIWLISLFTCMCIVAGNNLIYC